MAPGSPYPYGLSPHLVPLQNSAKVIQQRIKLKLKKYQQHAFNHHLGVGGKGGGIT